jgi:hypothetical protein
LDRFASIYPITVKRNTTTALNRMTSTFRQHILAQRKVNTAMSVCVYRLWEITLEGPREREEICIALDDQRILKGRYHGIRLKTLASAAKIPPSLQPCLGLSVEQAGEERDGFLVLLFSLHF